MRSAAPSSLSATTSTSSGRRSSLLREHEPDSVPVQKMAASRSNIQRTANEPMAYAGTRSAVFGQGNFTGRQTHLRQRTREPETVEQTESEGHRPRKTLHPTRAYASHARQLHGDGEDGERDQRLDRFWWDVDEPEHGEGERHAVSGRERRDSPQQPATSPHEQR